MRETQTVYVKAENQHHSGMRIKLAVYEDLKGGDKIESVDRIEAIVFTPEDYREDMVAFANFIRTNSYHVLNDNYQMYDGSGVLTISELFDIYQTTKTT